MPAGHRHPAPGDDQECRAPVMVIKVVDYRKEAVHNPGEPHPPRVFGVHDRQFSSELYSGCGWYRVVLPLEQLGIHGWETSWGVSLEPEHDPDVIVMQRLDNPAAVPYWRQLGEHYATVYEIDDDPFSI